MIRLIDREFVRICSFAFPADSPLPQLSKTLPRKLKRKMTSIDVDGDDLVTLRFHLRSRIACIQTREGIVAWQVGEPCKLQISYSQGSRQPLQDVESAEQAARFSTWVAHPPAGSGPMETTESLAGREQEEHSLSQNIMPSPVLERELDSSPGVHNGDLAQLHLQNGRNGAIAGIGPQETETNGAGDQARHGYVRLELLEGESEKPHTVLSSDTYSLAILGRYRLLTETLAGWMRATTAVVGS